MISPRRLSSPSGLDAAWRADFNAQRLTLCNGSLNIHRARSLRWAKRFRDWRPPSLDYGKGRRADRRRVECLLNFVMSASDQAAITYYSTVAERQQKTAKLRVSCGSSGIEIRVSPRVISGAFSLRQPLAAFRPSRQRERARARDRPRRLPCSARAITSPANSLSIPARPSEARTSAPTNSSRPERAQCASW
jgi:hypothetical protein